MTKTPVFRYFFLKPALFFLPIAALFVLPLAILWVTGEMTPVDRIIEKQQASEQPVLVGLAYSDPEKYFKLHSLLKVRPSIVVMGNSHMMPFQQDFFKGRKFYNAAVGGSRLPDFKDFIDHIPPGAEPKILIMGLDPFFAKPDYEWSQRENDTFDRKASLMDPVRILASAWIDIYRDYFRGKFSVDRLMTQKIVKNRIGLEAIMHGRGFLRDGSHISDQKSAVFSGRVKDYAYLKNGETFDGEGLSYLKELLDVCQRRGIYAIGILPPTRRAVYEQLRLSGYRYWVDLPDKLRPLFKEQGFSFYDFSNPDFFGGNDDEFDDDFHATEKAYRRISSNLLKTEKIFQH